MHGLMMDTPLLITEIMRFALQNQADVAVVSVTADEPRHRSTYGEVFRRAARLANAGHVVTALMLTEPFGRPRALTHRGPGARR